MHNIGVMSPDDGLMNVTGRTGDAGKFRTPSLWGVSHTAPYFHHGSMVNLGAAVNVYDRGRDDKTNLDFRIKPLNLTTQERNDLIDYMEDLTGSLLN